MSINNPYDAPLVSTTGPSNTATLQRIGAVSSAKVLGAIYALFGLILGACFSVLSAVGVAGNDASAPPMVFGIAAVVVMPIMYGFIGAVGGLIFAGLYNLIASTVGGIEMQFSE